MRIFKSLSQREYFSRDQGDLPPFFRELFAGVPGEVVQPETAAEIIDVVRVAHKNGTPLIARGAASTAFGQVLPVKGGLMLDLNFYKGVRKLDRGRSTVTVESGVRWSDLDAWLEPRGYGLGSYPSSWYSTVGGWVATGGYGLGSLKFGHLKDQVLELWAVSGDGRELRLKPGNPDFDAFFETEGQMGVILEVTLRVRQRPAAQTPVLLTFASFTDAWDGLRKVLSAPEGFDLFHASVYNRVRMEHFDKVLEEKMKRKAGLLPAGLTFGKDNAVLLVSEGDPSRLKAWAKTSGFTVEPDFKASFCWNERFYPLKGKKADDMFLGNEVLIANDKAGAYGADLERIGAGDDLHLAVEGEAAGKSRSLVLASFHAPGGDPVRFAKGLAAVFRMDRAGTVRHGGSLYHIGVYNTPFLSRKFGSERLAKLRAAKASLDPAGILNPGKFFTMTTRKTAWLPSWAHNLGARVLIATVSLPGLGGLFAALVAPWLGKRPASGGDKVLETANGCVNCGFCLPVCPAYLATKDERTTARGKLHLFKRWTSGHELSQDDVDLLHSCMHCGGCTAVCQSTLDLVPAWDELEDRVARDFGRPTRAIVDFVKSVEESDDYKRLLRKGTIAEYKTQVTGPNGQQQQQAASSQGSNVRIDSDKHEREDGGRGGRHRGRRRRGR